MDSDGFYTLVPKEDKPKDSSPKVKFRKGSWKDWLLRTARKWKPSPRVKDFHFTTMENFVICRAEKPKVIVTPAALPQKKLTRLKEKYGDGCFILINAGDQAYIRISLKSYMKLRKVDRIAVNLRLRGVYDGGKDVMDIYSYDQVIDNINELCRFINWHRQCVEGVYEIQSECCGYTEYDFRFKVVVLFTDGRAQTYKSDLNDFMKDFDLQPF